VERKRIHGLSPAEKSRSGIDSGLYTVQSSEQTYQRLADLAGMITQAGYTVIVDAAFLKHEQRDVFQKLAGKLDLPYIILDFSAPEELLRKWITERAAGGHDASEADIKVLEHQITTQQPLSEAERSYTLSIDSAHTVNTDALVNKIHSLMNQGRD
jgi:predicted kinase